MPDAYNTDIYFAFRTFFATIRAVEAGVKSTKDQMRDYKQARQVLLRDGFIQSAEGKIGITSKGEKYIEVNNLGPHDKELDAGERQKRNDLEEKFAQYIQARDQTDSGSSGDQVVIQQYNSLKDELVSKGLVDPVGDFQGFTDKVLEIKPGSIAGSKSDNDPAGISQALDPNTPMKTGDEKVDGLIDNLKSLTSDNPLESTEAMGQTGESLEGADITPEDLTPETLETIQPESDTEPDIYRDERPEEEILADAKSRIEKLFELQSKLQGFGGTQHQAEITPIYLRIGKKLDEEGYINFSENVLEKPTLTERGTQATESNSDDASFETPDFESHQDALEAAAQFLDSNSLDTGPDPSIEPEVDLSSDIGMGDTMSPETFSGLETPTPSDEQQVPRYYALIGKLNTGTTLSSDEQSELIDITEQLEARKFPVDRELIDKHLGDIGPKLNNDGSVPDDTEDNTDDPLGLRQDFAAPSDISGIPGPAEEGGIGSGGKRSQKAVNLYGDALARDLTRHLNKFYDMTKRIRQANRERPKRELPSHFLAEYYAEEQHLRQYGVVPSSRERGNWNALDAFRRLNPNLGMAPYWPPSEQRERAKNTAQLWTTKNPNAYNEWVATALHGGVTPTALVPFDEGPLSEDEILEGVDPSEKLQSARIRREAEFAAQRQRTDDLMEERLVEHRQDQAALIAQKAFEMRRAENQVAEAGRKSRSFTQDDIHYAFNPDERPADITDPGASSTTPEDTVYTRPQRITGTTQNTDPNNPDLSTVSPTQGPTKIASTQTYTRPQRITGSTLQAAPPPSSQQTVYGGPSAAYKTSGGRYLGLTVGSTPPGYGPPPPGYGPPPGSGGRTPGGGGQPPSPPGPPSSPGPSSSGQSGPRLTGTTYSTTPGPSRSQGPAFSRSDFFRNVYRQAVGQPGDINKQFGGLSQDVKGFVQTVNKPAVEHSAFRDWLETERHNTRNAQRKHALEDSEDLRAVETLRQQLIQQGAAVDRVSTEAKQKLSELQQQRAYERSDEAANLFEFTNQKGNRTIPVSARDVNDLRLVQINNDVWYQGIRGRYKGMLLKPLRPRSKVEKLVGIRAPATREDAKQFAKNIAESKTRQRASALLKRRGQRVSAEKLLPKALRSSTPSVHDPFAPAHFHELQNPFVASDLIIEREATPDMDFELTNLRAITPEFQEGPIDEPLIYHSLPAAAPAFELPFPEPLVENLLEVEARFAEIPQVESQSRQRTPGLQERGL